MQEVQAIRRLSGGFAYWENIKISRNIFGVAQSMGMTVYYALLGDSVFERTYFGYGSLLCRIR